MKIGEFHLFILILLHFLEAVCIIKERFEAKQAQLPPEFKAESSFLRLKWKITINANKCLNGLHSSVLKGGPV